MSNWIGAGIWIAIGIVVAFLARLVIRRPEADGPGDTLLLLVLGAFGATVGGMLGVGIFHFYEPRAVSPGGIASAVVLAALMAGLYRWGIRGLV